MCRYISSLAIKNHLFSSSWFRLIDGQISGDIFLVDVNTNLAKIRLLSFSSCCMTIEKIHISGLSSFFIVHIFGSYFVLIFTTICATNTFNGIFWNTYIPANYRTNAKPLYALHYHMLPTSMPSVQVSLSFWRVILDYGIPNFWLLMLRPSWWIGWMIVFFGWDSDIIICLRRSWESL